MQDSTFFPLRERTNFAALDSGLLLWRANILILFCVFAIPIAFLTAIGALVPFEINDLVFYLVIWWLKPLFDRMALHIVSVSFFNKEAKGKTLLRGIRGSIMSGLAGDLLWRRFSIRRSAVMPLRVLEAHGGKKLLERKKALEAGGLNFGLFLTVFCFILECMLYISDLVFYAVFNQMLNLSLLIKAESKLLFWIEYLPYIINYIFVETLYVSAGFALYINSRVIVEGWDLQIAFKKAASNEE
ncbi:MAG: hypothetical protein Ta2G_08230 [Termitinemataceae bacterium]|nr:MAG: hypothetical protein Ta2G_08230 [Termitinemataceae bacterium]